MWVLAPLHSGKPSRRKIHSSFDQSTVMLSLAILIGLVGSCPTQLSATRQRGEQTPVAETVSTDWMHWTAAECDAILNGSFIGTSRWTFAPSRLIKIQLRSALPVRQALLRQSQLNSGYERMTAEQKLKFDRQNPLETEDNKNDAILLYVEHNGGESCVLGPPPLYNCQEQVYRSPLPAREVAMRLPDGALVMPVKTEALQNDTGSNKFLYSFPRTISGKSALNVNDASLKFVFGRELPGGGRERPLQNAKRFRIANSSQESLPNVVFPIAELMYNGELTY